MAKTEMTPGDGGRGGLHLGGGAFDASAPAGIVAGQHAGGFAERSAPPRRCHFNGHIFHARRALQRGFGGDHAGVGNAGVGAGGAAFETTRSVATGGAPSWRRATATTSGSG